MNIPPLILSYPGTPENGPLNFDVRLDPHKKGNKKRLFLALDARDTLSQSTHLLDDASLSRNRRPCPRYPVGISSFPSKEMVRRS